MSARQRSPRASSGEKYSTRCISRMTRTTSLGPRPSEWSEWSKVKGLDLADRRPDFGRNHSLGDNAEVCEGLLAGGTTGSQAGMTMVMGAVKLKIQDLSPR